MASYIEYLPNDAPYNFQDRIWSASFNDTQLHLVNDISKRYAELNTEFASLKRRLDAVESGADGPPGKKRRLENGGSTNGVGAELAGAAQGLALGAPSFTADGISFVTPQRKKFKVGLVPEGEPGTGGLTIDGNLLVRWKDVEQVIRVAVPDKASPAHYFVLIPGPSARGSTSAAEPTVFTVPDTKPQPQDVAFAPGQYTYADLPMHELFSTLIDAELRKLGRRIARPDAREFQSAKVQAHRKGERAYHVPAFRGSKDGFLHFLSSGILWGFKKPLLFLPLHAITSTSYSSVLQRTFNLNVAVRLSAADCTFCIPGAPTAEGEVKEEEYEFSMLDQVDFAGIDAYVKGHGLHDASLAEGRRAKWFGTEGKGGVKKEREVQPTQMQGGEEEEEEEETEMQRAERELQDAEDAEEEDYEESGGESDGSGESSEEEDEAEGGGGDEGAELSQEDLTEEGESEGEE